MKKALKEWTVDARQEEKQRTGKTAGYEIQIARRQSVLTLELGETEMTRTQASSKVRKVETMSSKKNEI